MALEAVATEVDSSDEALPGRERLPLIERFFLRRLRSGDPKAFRELVKQHENRVYSLVFRMVGDAQEAQDLCQEVFLAVHRNLPRFRADCRLSTWIYRIAKNLCLNRLKYLEHRAPGGEADLERVESEAAFGARTPRPDEALFGAEEREQVQRALERLSPAHRLLLVMRDIEGLEYEQIARVAELPLGTVKSRIHRARAQLAGHLEEAGMAPEAP